MARLTDALRRRIAKDQRGRCWYCSLQLHDDQTWEHIVARYHGGDNRLANVGYITHAKCNSIVGTAPTMTKYSLHDIGWTYGSDAFFLLVVQLKAMTNGHDDYQDLRRKRPKRPPRAIHEANVSTLVSCLPEELRIPLAA